MPVQPAACDPLDDPARLAFTRRLVAELSTSAPFDRLAGLTARLLRVETAQVVLFTDVAVAVGGFGHPTVQGPVNPLADAPGVVAARLGVPLVVPDAAADGRFAGVPAVAAGDVRSLVSLPLVLAGHAVGALTVLSPLPRTWSADDVAVAAEVAAAVRTELELAAASAELRGSLSRLEVALSASMVGVWEMDLATGRTTWDEHCAALFARDPGCDATENVLEHVHPDDRAAVEEAMSAAVAGRGHFAAEMRILHSDGSARWVVSRGRVLTDAAGRPDRLLGALVDVTEARYSAEARLASLQRTTAIAEVAAELAGAGRIDQLAEITLRGAEVLGAETGALAVFDRHGGLRVHLGSRLKDIVEVAAAEVGVAAPPDGVEIELDDSLPTQWVARHGVRVLLPDPAAAAARFPRMAEMTRLLGAQALAALPLRVEGRLLGAFVAVWNAPHPFGDDDVEVLEALTAQIALSVLRLQADAERNAAVAEMAATNDRLQLLAEAGRVLSGTLDIGEQIGQLTELVVPALGDWCWLFVTDEHGRLRDLASAHSDPARTAELADYVRAMLAELTDESGTAEVIRTGRPLVLPTIEPDLVERALPGTEARQRLAALAPASGVVLPLLAGGRALGAFGLFNGAGRAPHTPAEIDTALEVGRRAGLALQQARLFGQQRQLAETLQRSLLTAPPAPGHCEIAVRYVPAAAGAEIGGDWYDAFVQPEGATVLVIGDVVGHDSRAAAAMGQLRGLLRGIGYHTGGPPAEVLTGLDQAARGLDLDTMATALVARLEQDGPELQAGQTRVRWSTAGHPPPLLLSPDGVATLLDGDPPDLLLGVDPATPRVDRVAAIAAGGALLLYTDGLVERRDRDLDAGMEELRGVVEELAQLPLQELCDRLLERMFLPDTEDDVALLAVRVHPQDAPLPLEAGPQRVPAGTGRDPDAPTPRP
ncbi:MAG TPA: SpoIIE family protein phosphatase [Modestobacter sp.]|nr:SpoIIE family protein phosphatase [Modestobacter sp.]